MYSSSNNPISGPVLIPSLKYSVVRTYCLKRRQLRTFRVDRKRRDCVPTICFCPALTRNASVAYIGNATPATLEVNNA